MINDDLDKYMKILKKSLGNIKHRFKNDINRSG